MRQAAVGGFGSGNGGGRPTTNAGLTLDLPSLMRGGFCAGLGRKGTLDWMSERTGQPFASIGFLVTMGEERGRLRLTYTTTNTATGEKHASDYWIDLVSTPQPFGGRRWWFRCPASGRRVVKLYLPPGQTVFACRKAHRLGYASQRQSPRDRATSQAFKLRHQLGAAGAIGDHVPKPKWMRWATYDRKMDRLAEAEGRCNGFLIASFSRLMERTRRSGII